MSVSNFENASLLESKRQTSRLLDDAEDGFTMLLLFLELYIGNYVKAFVNLIGVGLALINNITIIFVLSYGSEVKNAITMQMRIYYFVLALCDLSTIMPLHATYWLGIFKTLNTFTN